MTLGIMAGSVFSGQMISRTGRYRKFPVIGAALLMLSLFAFRFVAYDTPLWQTMVVMVFFGVGLGFNFQPLTLAVQNAVPPQQIGVATATATFTRQIGGTLGTAVFLSAMLVVFTTLIGALMGLRAADQASLDIVTVYGGGRWKQLTKVRLIAALPAVLNALKIGAPLAFLGAVIGEYLGGVAVGIGPQRRVDAPPQPR